MDEATQYVVGSVLGNLLCGVAIFFLTKFLFRYPARNFLVAKICFGLFFLGGALKIAQFFQKDGGVYYSDLEVLMLAIAFVLGSAAGYWRGYKKHSKKIFYINDTVPTDKNNEFNIALETFKLSIFILLSVILAFSTFLIFDKLRWHPEQAPIFMFISLLCSFSLIVVYKNKKCSYKRIVLSHKPNTPLKRMALILTCFSVLYVVYNIIVWCNFAGVEETEDLLYSILLFFTCLSFVLGIPQRIFAWIKSGK